MILLKIRVDERKLFYLGHIEYVCAVKFSKRMLMVQKIDALNFILIVVSLLLAVILPFQTFLYSYAILGPLHYLTEINWLNDKNFFVERSFFFKWVVVVFSVVYVVPFVLQLPLFSDYFEESFLQEVKMIQPWMNGVTMAVLGLAIGFVFFNNLIVGIVLFVIFGLSVLVLVENDFYSAWVGVFLPTLIHVYIFTSFFMLYGTLKSKNNIGFLNVALMIMVPFIIGGLPNSIIAKPDHSLSVVYFENNFHLINGRVAQLFGFPLPQMNMKIQVFIAFAYIYHYLNWFTKTTVIGWHKKLTTKKTMLISIMWVTSIFLYWVDFKMGFLFVLFFSVLHVFSELPLNIISIRGISEFLFTKKEG